MKKILSLRFLHWSKNILRTVFCSPARISVMAFLLLILSGTLLLSMPVSSKAESPAFVDSFFMATYAACVTGLSIMDIQAELSFFGQGVLLCLIQIGGLGIMTLSTVLILLVGGRQALQNSI